MRKQYRTAHTQRAAHDFLHRLPLRIQLDLARLKSRHVEQVIDELRKPLRFCED